MRAYLRALGAGGAPVLLVGDLNVAHLDADIWNVDAKHIPKSAGTTPAERAAFATLLSECAMVDTFRARHPDATGCFTYWSARAFGRPVNRGLRLDYALASAHVVPGAAAGAAGAVAGGMEVVDAFHLDTPWSGADTVSDHCPVGVTLALP